MKDKILLKENLVSFGNSLIEQYRLVAPVKSNGFSLYKPVGNASEICLDYLRPLKSAKEIFFPQNETLFFFNKKTQKIAEPAYDKKPTILFGAVACDLAGIAAQDRLFSAGAYLDSYYLKRRRNSILIGMACPEPGEMCFCGFFGIDRFASDIADLFFTPFSDKYYIKVNTEAGARLVESLPDAAAADAKTVERLRCENAEPKWDIPPLDELARMLAEGFEADVWDEIAQKCIGCAACTFVCPTCHCFDITDEAKGEIGRRVRTWDGCMFPKFTLHASGHNPRTKGGQRMRQRILHKFSYFKDNQGVVSCTGCGRCAEICPVNVDIREVLKQLGEACERKS